MEVVSKLRLWRVFSWSARLASVEAGDHGRTQSHARQGTGTRGTWAGAADTWRRSSADDGGD